MKIISHRGNTNGPDVYIENNPLHISKLLDKNIDVEIDVWVDDSNLICLGHDNPQYIVNHDFITRNGLWCHAKNLKAFQYLLKNGCNCFWHQEDDFTLTSSGLIWTYPDKQTCEQSIIVDVTPNWKDKNYNCFGVCVDYL